MAMAEPDAGQRFDIEVGERGALSLRELAHLLLGEGDVLLELVGHGGRGGVELPVLDEEPLRRPAVEPERPVAEGILAAALDVVEDARHRGANVRARLRRRQRRALQVVGHA